MLYERDRRRSKKIARLRFPIRVKGITFSPECSKASGKGVWKILCNGLNNSVPPRLALKFSTKAEAASSRRLSYGMDRGNSYSKVEPNLIMLKHAVVGKDRKKICMD